MITYILAVTVLLLCCSVLAQCWCGAHRVDTCTHHRLASTRNNYSRIVYSRLYGTKSGKNKEDNEIDADFDNLFDPEEDEVKGKTSAKGRRPLVFNMKGKWKILNRGLLAGIFVAGIGAGVTIDSAINTNPKDLASRDAIDKNAPNPKLCAKYGSSAMVLDQRVFVTFNPFNVYVTQADTKPGCVLRPSNVVPLLQQERKLLTDEDIQSCKNGFNTWAYVGDVNSRPQLSCVFQSDDAQNEFLSNPKVGLGEDVYDK